MLIHSSVLRKESKMVFEHWKREKYYFGQKKHQKKYMKKKLANTVLMQRSSRKRLYDHNIFLRGLLSGKVYHKKEGNLSLRFVNALFVDIGSAVIFMEGAPTVRDIYEDVFLRKNLSQIIATDINDRRTKGNNYIDIYRKKRKPLPFPVEEIPMCLDTERKIAALTAKYLKSDEAVIFRSASSGPDLYYDRNGVKNHLKAIIGALCNRDVLYLFNKYVFFKSADSLSFEVIGVIDPRIGFDHRKIRWHKINWKKRKLRESFFPGKDIVTVH
jgi:hypothetical protein